MMAVVKIENVKQYRDKRGKLKLYYRKKSQKLFRLRGPIGSPEFWEDYNAARASASKSVIPGQHQIASGTISALIAEYYQSLQFIKLRDSTKATYRGVLEAFRASHGHKQVRSLRRMHVEGMMDDLAEFPGAAYSFLKRLKTLMNFAIIREYRTDNPALLIKPPALKGIRPLTDDDIQKYLDYWKEGTRQRRAFLTLLYTGQRRSDAVGLGRQHIKDGRISVVQQKTGARLWIKIHPALQAEIDLMPPDHLLFIASEAGAPITPETLGNFFGDWCDKAGLPVDSSPHGCRKAAGRRLAEAGNSAKQIAAVLGHATLSEVERYTRDADQIRLADEAIDRML